MDDAAIVQEMEEYLRNFIEKPSSAFGGMPVCPFAAKARTEKKIQYIVISFAAAEIPRIKQLIDSFINQSSFELIMFIHPDKMGMSIEEFDKFADEITKIIPPTYALFNGHPNDPTIIAGIETRRDPYPNFLIQPFKKIEEARSILKAEYYKNWTAEEKRKDGLV